MLPLSRTLGIAIQIADTDLAFRIPPLVFEFVGDCLFQRREGHNYRWAHLLLLRSRILYLSLGLSLIVGCNLAIESKISNMRHT
jgi:hypothetical protein